MAEMPAASSTTDSLEPAGQHSMLARVASRRLTTFMFSWPAAVIVYTLGAFAVTASAWAAPATRWIGGCCDPEQSIWFIRWFPYAVGHGLDPLFSYQINAPDGVNLMWNASIPLLGLVATPITLLAGPFLAYNLLLVTALILSAASARLALTRFSSGGIGPAVGGAIYGFSPYVVPHAGLHLNLASAWGPPLFLVLIDSVVLRRTTAAWRLGIGIGILAAAQLLVAEELLATSAIAALVLLVTVAVDARRAPAFHVSLRRLVISSLTAVATFLPLAAWPLATQFLGPQQIQGSVQDAGRFSTDLLNLVLPTPNQLLSPAAATAISVHFSGLFHEANAYVGLPLLFVLTVLVARNWHDGRIRVAAIVGGVMLLASLGPHLQIGGESTGLPLPWIIVGWMPLLEHVLPSRLAVFMWLSIAVIVSIAIDAQLRLPALRAIPRIVVVALATVLIVPAPLGSSTAAVPVFFERWADEGIPRDANVLIAPFFRDGAGADPMVWAAVAGAEVRMPEAYAYVPSAEGTASYGPPPTQVSQVMEEIQDRGVFLVAGAGVREQIARDLEAKHITDVIVGPMAHRAQMITFFTDLFGRTPDVVDGVEIWRGVDHAGVAPKP